MINRKLKIVRVDHHLIIDLLMSCKRNRYVSLPICDDLPEGTDVVDVRENWRVRCLDILVTHPDFEDVPDGQEPPSVFMEYRVFQQKVLSDIVEPVS